MFRKLAAFFNILPGFLKLVFHFGAQTRPVDGRMPAYEEGWQGSTRWGMLLRLSKS